MPENNIIGKFKLAGYEKRLLLGKPAEVHELDELSFDTEVIEEHYEVILAFVYTLEEMAARGTLGALLWARTTSSGQTGTRSVAAGPILL